MATTDTNVPQVIVNKLTSAEYATATKSPTEFYAVTDGKIETADIADGAVTTAKLADGAVTGGKIGQFAQVVDPSDYITLDSGATDTGTVAWKLGPIVWLYLSINATIGTGQTIIGTTTSKVLHPSYGAARVITANSDVFPAVHVYIENGGQIRAHTEHAGISTAGTVMLIVND